MFLRIFVCIVLIIGLSGCSSVSGKKTFSSKNAVGYYIPKPISCVPYARDVSGIQIRGDAYTWWDQATGRYQCSSAPKKGAVFVLAKSSRLRYGHLSVVKNVIDNRNIEVTHSNWGDDKATRSMIYERMLVEDISPANDWSNVRFWNHHIDSFGLPYPAYGFIYPS